jgi:beta-glucosidase
MTIMSSYNLVNGVHTANSHDLLTAAARDEWGFAGYVMTDWGTSEDMSGLFAYKYNLKYGHSTSRECVLAGNDLQMPGQKGNRQEIVASVADGTLPLGQLQTCAYRILNVVLQSLAYDDCKPYGDQFDLAEAVTVTKA